MGVNNHQKRTYYNFFNVVLQTEMNCISNVRKFHGLTNERIAKNNFDFSAIY